jgi:8-oxo-dGTP diphosphatase
MKTSIRAAGGVVYRHGPAGRREVLLVHRAHREDWTFPKGKRRGDEDDDACARREVEEETGLRCALGIELPTTTYITRSGRRKLVRYWAMRPVAGAVGPRNEVDEVRWVGLEAATPLLTYPRDRALLLAFVRLGLDRARGGPIGRQSRRSTLLRTSARGLDGGHGPRARRAGTG